MKYTLLVLIACWGIHCSAHDAQYYGLHPKDLQQAIAGCPGKQPRDLSCDQLKDIAYTVNQLAYQLQLNPQRYGQVILSLQEEIAKQELSSNPSTPSILKDKQLELAARLAVVKWLESPNG